MIDMGKILLFDGAMGTMLQRRGLKLGAVPEALNLTAPEEITAIHKEYLEAGADVVLSNTFGANRFKAEKAGAPLADIVRAGVRNARAAADSFGGRYAALDIGPCGRVLKPSGDLEFDEAVEVFAEIVRAGEGEGADFILLETFTDLYELKAAVIAAKENSKLPIFATMSFEENGTTFFGACVESMVATLEALGVLGARRQLLARPETARADSEAHPRLRAHPRPRSAERGTARYTRRRNGIRRYAGAVRRVRARIRRGGRALHRRLLRHDARVHPPRPRRDRGPFAEGARRSAPHRNLLAVARRELRRRNHGNRRASQPDRQKSAPGGSARARHGLPAARGASPAGAGRAGARPQHGAADIDEAAALAEAAQKIQAVTPLPLQLDSSSPAALERAARLYNGKPLLNSVNGKKESLESILPIAKKYGCAVLGLALDENGVPKTAEARLEIARRIVTAAEAAGIPREDVLIDCLVMTASAQQEQAAETLKALALVKKELGVKTVLGVSNVSFGLPMRPVVNRTMLAMAFAMGLDAPIMNPGDAGMAETVAAARVLLGEDKEAAAYIARCSAAAPEQKPEAKQESRADIHYAITHGLEDEAAKAAEELLAGGTQPMSVIEEKIIPALDAVGKDYETGAIFLPQLIKSAEAAKASFEVLRAKLAREGGAQKGAKFVIATVYGDIHDIGKNIVRVILENYNFDVTDLGRDVPPERVAQAVRETGAKIVGLSALMTTTVASMKDTIALLRRECPDVKIIVGGAVLTPHLAEYAGADYYAKDAMETVRIAEKLSAEAK